MWLESVHLSLSHSDLIVLTWWNPTSPFSEPHKSSWDVEMGNGTKWASKFRDFRKEKEQREQKQEEFQEPTSYPTHADCTAERAFFHTLLTLG